jgi:hypothetical protein
MSTSYATTGELKTRLGITDAVDDVTLGAVLEAVSRGIDNYCGRSFDQTAAGVVRYYTPQYSDEVMIADCVTLTAVASDHDGDRTYEYTWLATDYDLLPENASTDSLPYTAIATSPDGDYNFPVGVRKGLKLTGTWGWPVVPAPVHEACLIQSARVFKRKDAPFGISGSPEMGQMRLGRLDPDVMWLLDTYRDIAVA